MSRRMQTSVSSVVAEHSRAKCPTKTRSGQDCCQGEAACDQGRPRCKAERYIAWR